MHHVVACGIIKPPLDNGFCQPSLAISADASRSATQRGYERVRSLRLWEVLVLVPSLVGYFAWLKSAEY